MQDDAPVRVLVTGARALLASDLSMSDHFDLFVDGKKQYELLHGGAYGADTLAAQEAQRRGFKVNGVKPDWNRYGRSAGHVRNAEMVNMSPEIVVAFIKGASVGTRGCLKLVAKSKTVKTIYLWDEGTCHVLTCQELAAHLGL